MAGSEGGSDVVVAAKKRRVSAGPQSYVVQVKVEGGGPRPEGDAAGGALEGATWVDVATVTVPPRSQRRTIIRAALEESGYGVGDAGEVMRVLDAGSALETPVGKRQPPAELVIG